MDHVDSHNLLDRVLAMSQNPQDRIYQDYVQTQCYHTKNVLIDQEFDGLGSRGIGTEAVTTSLPRSDD